MAYLVQIDDSTQGKELMNFLKTLDYVKVYDKNKISGKTQRQIIDLYNSAGGRLTTDEINELLETAEQSGEISFEDAVEASEEWKTKRK